MSAFAIDFPDGVPTNAVYLTKSDSGSAYSLQTGAANNWSDGAAIQATDTNKVYFVPAGLGARAQNEKVVPIVYCAGYVYPVQSGNGTVTFNDLRLLDGGYVYGKQISMKAGNITILAEDPDNPAKLVYARDVDENYRENREFRLNATLAGSEGSQLLYTNQAGGENKNYLTMYAESDWSGFKGTLRVDDGFGLGSSASAPIASPCAVKFGTGCKLRLAADSSPFSFGELIFVENGAITNTGAGATLTVSGTFDTGTNSTWLSRNPGTFGTLILNDGLTLRDDQATPKTVLTVTNRLVVGENVTIEYPNVKTVLSKVLLMKLSPEAVQAGVPDLSGVAVSHGDTLSQLEMRLTTETDPDVSGGLLVYTASQAETVYYNGPDEFDNSGYRGAWIDPDRAPQYWSDGLYPSNPDKIYATKDVVFGQDVDTFPGRTLTISDYIYLLSSSFYVTNLVVMKNGLYGRANNIHIGGNITAGANFRFRMLASRNFYIDAALHGGNQIYFDSYYPDGTGATFYLTADNSDWNGVIRSEWHDKEDGNYPPDETHHTRIVVSDAKALGGDIESFVYNQIRLGDYTEIRFTKTTVYDAPNRGIYTNPGTLNVDEGATAELKMPVTQRGHLYKIGAGTLCFGGGLRFGGNNDLTDPTAASASMITYVREGSIKGASLARARVSFSDGAGIAADTASGAMDLTGAKAVAAEGTICLKADANTLPEPTEPVVYPIVKVTSTQNATLGPKFKAARVWKGWSAELVSETDAKGNVTYSVRYAKRGFVLSIL